MPATPKFHRIAPGDYETADGKWRLLQLDGGDTRAWNVEMTDRAIQAWIDEDPENRSPYSHELDAMPVDGAATKRDALALFADYVEARS